MQSSRPAQVAEEEEEKERELTRDVNNIAIPDTTSQGQLSCSHRTVMSGTSSGHSARAAVQP
jgi:hypothetical protein